MTIIGSTNNANWTFKLEAYERGETIDINNNTSVVRVDVFIGRASSRSYCGGSFSGSVTVDGQVQGFSGTIPYPTYVDGGAWLYTGITKDFTVGHNADGSKTVGVSSSWSADFTPSSASANGSLGLTTIARKTGLSNQTGTINNQMTISFSPASSSFRHTLTYSFGSASGTLATKTSATSINWTPPTSLYQYISNAKSGVGSLTLTTFSGDTNIGSNTARLTLNQDLSDVKPTISTVSITDTNTITSTLTGNPNVIVANASTLSASVTGKTKYYSTGKSITVGGQPMTITSTQDDVDYDVSGTLTITEPNITSLDVILTDMRDNASDTYTPSENTIINYFKPTLSFNAFRPSPTTGEIDVEYSGNFWAGNFATNTPNQLILQWEYKTSDSNTWTTGGTLSGYTIDSNTNTYTGSESLGNIFDYRNNYNIRIKYGDSVNNGTLFESAPATVVRGIPVFYWTENKFKINGNLYANNFYENNFSTTERVVGEWINGKPIYAKTIIDYPTYSGEQVRIDLNVSNIELVWVDKGNSFLLSSGGNTYCGIGNDGNDGYWFDIRQVLPSQGYLNCKIGQSIYSNSTVYITIFYTKTTD